MAADTGSATRPAGKAVEIPTRRGSDDRLRDVRTDDDLRVDEARGDTTGLSSREAARRLTRYGANDVAEEHRSLLLEVLGHFWGPIPWMIEAALVLTAVTGRWVDFGIIAALLVLNGGVGFWEEHQAESAIAALKGRLARSAEVDRDGEWQTIPAVQVVPGDLVRVGRGQIVPADGHIVAGECETDESALTGESLPVEKAPGDPAYSGSAVSRGTPVLRVTATGAQTMFGRTAQLAGAQAPQSHFQQAIMRIGKYLIVLALALVAVIVVVSLARGTSLTHTLEFALVVTIASIPVALPAVLSVAMAVGARQLARHEAVVSHLPAVEEMAGVDVLCADKTGTITKNELGVADVTVLADGIERSDVLREAALTVETGTDDPIDRAILAAVTGRALDGWEASDLKPFDPIHKRAEATAIGPDGVPRQVAKGAVQAVLALPGIDAEVGRRLDEVTRGFAAKGYRALAVARNRQGTALDGHRCARAAGSTPRRLRRHPRRGRSARGDGEDGHRRPGGDRPRDRHGDRPRRQHPPRGPHQRHARRGRTGRRGRARRRVRPGRARGQVPHRRCPAACDHIVAMTGDGVNDAAALRRADAGIAVSGATDAARAASDIVLLAPGLSTIVEAIYRSREVFRRMENYAIYRITETIRVVCFVTLTIVAFAFFPVTPVQVVLLAILNDAAILSIAYDRVLPSSRPERWDLTAVLTIAAVLGTVGLISTFGLVWASHGPMAVNDDHVRTLIYLKLSVSGHLTVFLARTRGPWWSHRPATILVAAVVGTQILATVIALTGLLMTPIGWDLVALAWGWAAAEFLLLDPIKLVGYRLLERRGIAAAPITGGAPR